MKKILLCTGDIVIYLFYQRDFIIAFNICHRTCHWAYHQNKKNAKIMQIHYTGSIQIMGKTYHVITHQQFQSNQPNHLKFNIQQLNEHHVSVEVFLSQYLLQILMTSVLIFGRCQHEDGILKMRGMKSLKTESRQRRKIQGVAGFSTITGEEDEYAEGPLLVDNQVAEDNTSPCFQLTS